MFLSRVTLDLGKLTPEMMQKWQPLCQSSMALAAFFSSR